MASFSRAIRDLDDAIDETRRLRRQAETDRLDQDLVRKLNLKSEFD